MHDIMRTMSEWLSLIVLGIVQGLTEFLPVSSTGHLILARDLFGFSSEYGLAIDAVLQLATLGAVLVYFWRDILNLFLPAYRNVAIAIVVGTVPAVIIGLFLEDTMATLFRSTELVAYALLAGSVVMLAAEYLSKLRPEQVVGWRQGLVIGLFQALALIPGMSRSGMTISGGMCMGLTRSEAARFGFLLSIPILLGSGLKKLIDLQSEGVLTALSVPLLGGMVAAFVSGLVAIYVLLAIVRKTPLTVFVVYRVLLAVCILTLL